MADDPELREIKGILSEIPKGQLSERQTRIAAAIALVERGTSMRTAAKEAGCAYATLWRIITNKAMPTSEKGVAGAEKELVAASFDVAQLAAERLVDRLSDPDAEWFNGDLIKAYGVATDKIAMRRRWRDGVETRGDEGGATTLAKMLAGATITFPAAKAGDEVIDVTPGE